MKNLANKIGLGLLISGVASAFTSQKAKAQVKSEYKDHDTGAKFKGFTPTSKKIFEEKAFYNEPKKRHDRFYIQYLDTAQYKNDLNIAALPFYGTMPIMNSTGAPSYLVSDSMFVFFPEPYRSFEIKESHVSDRCIFQIIEKAGVGEGMNFISTSSVKDYFKSLREDCVLELGDGKSFLTFTLPTEKQVEEKTNQIYLPLNDDKIQFGIHPVTKKLWAFGTIYRGNLKLGPVMASGTTGVVSKLGELDNFADVIDKAKTLEDSVIAEVDTIDQKRDFYLIGGVSGNGQFLGLDIGAGYGPVAIRGRVSKAKDEPLVNHPAIPSPNTGRQYPTIKENVDVNELSVLAEVRSFQDKFTTLVIGAGPNKTEYTQLIQEGGNHNSFSKKEWSAIIEGGVSLGKNHKVDILTGWKTRKIPELNAPINSVPQDNWKNQAYLTVSYVRNLGYPRTGKNKKNRGKK